MRGRPFWPRGKLCSDTEDRVNEPALGYRITLGYPADLPFANCVHRLITFDRSPRPLHRTETKAGRDPLLDEAMILLDNVVQIRRGSAATAPVEFPALLQVGHGTGICWMPIHVDHPRRRPTSRQR